MNRIKNNNAGDWVYLSKGYTAFIPNELPIKNLVLNNDVLKQLQKTKEKIVDFNNRDFLNDFGKKSIDIFAKFFLMKEAIYSSKIEGIETSKEELLKAIYTKNNLTAFLTNDVLNNYIALKDAFVLANELPLVQKFFRKTHTILLRNPDKAYCNPGEFRISQNWIGREGTSLDNAMFVPPPPEELTRLLSNLEKYINNKTEEDSLVKAAIIHSQFETIHPFLDGNGRIGRIINSIFMNNNICDSRYFVFSDTIYKNLSEYYRNLQLVHDLGDWNSWILFYLKMIEEAAANSEYLLFCLANHCNLDEIRLKKLIEKDSLIDAINLLKNFATNIIFDSKSSDIGEQRLKYLLSKFQEYNIITKLDKNIYKYNNIFNLL